MNEETSWKLKIDQLRDKFLLVFTVVPLATFTFHLSINTKLNTGTAFELHIPGSPTLLLLLSNYKDARGVEVGKRSSCNIFQVNSWSLSLFVKKVMSYLLQSLRLAHSIFARH